MKNNTVNKAKVTLPYYISTFGVVEVKLFLEYLRAIGKLTSEQVKGYKASVNETNFMNVLDSVDHLHRSNNHGSWSRWIYVNFSNYDIATKNTFSFPLSIGNLYEKFMLEKFNIDSNNCKFLHVEFFKYTPFLRSVVDDIDEWRLTDGYCCSDCDGPAEEHIRRRLEGELRYNIEKLNNINLK